MISMHYILWLICIIFWRFANLSK